jgi:hypothetical protein
MCLKKAVKAAALILSFSLLFSVLFACGELSTPLFSSEGTYQVRALVNGNSLDSCSLIRQNDKIIPYFTVSVVNDPDLMGLLVYLQNSKGEIVGEKVLYTIHPMDDAIQPETQQEETKPEDNTTEISGGTVSGDNDSTASERGTTSTTSGDNDSTASERGTSSERGTTSGAGETTGQTETGLTGQGTERTTSVDTKPSGKKYDTVILIRSFQQEMPNFSLPKNLEVGSYSLVFEAVDRSFNTLSLIESDIFYLGSVEFRLNDISMYLPGLSDTRLIPPGTTVMLEAGLDFDSSLSPYVIWYNGRNIISEGNINEGAGNILWEAPEQSGFYSLRLEVLPFKLKRSFTGIFRDITLPVSAKASQTSYFFGDGPDYPAKRTLVEGTAYPEQVKLAAELAAKANKAVLSDKAANRTPITPVPPEHPELLRWYRFDGSLDETSLIPNRKFEPAEEKVSRWTAVGKSYWLSTGPDDTFLLRPIRFFRQDQDQGGGIFLFHIRPAAEGTVFSAFFPTLTSASALASASDGVWMDMTAQEKVITLRLKTKAASVEMTVNTDYSEEQGLIPIVIEFYIRPYRFEAKISLGETLSAQSNTEEIQLPGALAGEGRIRLGVDKTAPVVETRTTETRVSPNLTETKETEETDPPPANSSARDISTTVQPVTTIWDEFAVLYSATPLLPEEIPVEDNDSEETEEPQKQETPINTPASQRPKPNSAAPGPGNVNPVDTPLENETPLSGTQTEDIPEPAETEDEETPSLISLP